jgi:hypothetical protein
MINAHCHSDDNTIKVNFDATAFFESELTKTQTLDASLAALDACDFAGDYATDAIAEFFADADTKTLFDYLAMLNKGGVECGYYCEVDKDDVLAWLQQHAPESVPIIT